MTQYIIITDDSENSTNHLIDTDEERDEARAAMTDAGLEECAVFVGDPEDPSSYVSGAWFKNESGEIHAAPDVPEFGLLPEDGPCRNCELASSGCPRCGLDDGTR